MQFACINEEGNSSLQLTRACNTRLEEDVSIGTVFLYIRGTNCQEMKVYNTFQPCLNT
jgi:hypothetical protein